MVYGPRWAGKRLLPYLLEVIAKNMDAMIQVTKLSKRFGAQTVVDDISFTIGQGEVLGFLGPNGAGKSTTMKMITGFLTPSSGTAVVCGHNVATAPLQVKQKIGYLPEGAPAYADMTPSAFLKFVGRLRGYKGAELTSRVETAIERVNLQSVVYKPIETLSKGFKRRVGIAQSILHDPPVLIMDEPTDGLDPNQKHEVRDLIAKMARDKAIIISTHILEEVSAVCTRAIIIAQGRLLFDGTPTRLAALSDFNQAVRLRVANSNPADLVLALTELPHVTRAEAASDGSATVIVFAKDGHPIVRDISQLARDRGWQIDELTVEGGHLDEVFRRITTQSQELRQGVLS